MCRGEVERNNLRIVHIHYMVKNLSSKLLKGRAELKPLHLYYLDVFCCSALFTLSKLQCWPAEVKCLKPVAWEVAAMES